MSDLVPVPPAAAGLDLARLRAASTADLRAELVNALKLTAGHLCYLAAVWQELEARGVDLGDLRRGIGAYLPLIAAGTVAAETVVAYAGQPRLLKQIGGLPVDRQRRIAAGEEPPPAPPPKKPALVRSDPVIPGAMTARPAAVPAGEPTDDQLDAACAAPAKGPIEMLKAMAANCGPRDLAETVVEAVRANPSPAAVASHLLVLLDPIAQKRERRGGGGITPR